VSQGRARSPTASWHRAWETRPSNALSALARAAPGLVDEVISHDGRDLIGEYTLKLGGRTFVGDLDEAVRVPEDGRVTLMGFSDL